MGEFERIEVRFMSKMKEYLNKLDYYDGYNKGFKDGITTRHEPTKNVILVKPKIKKPPKISFLGTCPKRITFYIHPKDSKKRRRVSFLARR